MSGACEMEFGIKKLFAVTVAGLAVILLSFPVSAEKTPSPVASVNGVPISGSEFDSELDQVKMRYMRQGREIDEPQLKKFKESILEILINRELLFQESKRLGIQVDEKKIFDQLMTVKQRFPSEAEYQKVLGEMKLTEEDLKFQIKRALTIRELVEGKITQKIKISDKESRDYYDTHPQAFKQAEEVKASHILIKVDADADSSKKAEARKKIEQIQTRLQNGDDFSTLAKEHSEGPSSGKGGDLGYFKRGEMVKPFEDAAFALKPDEVSNIVETPFGYHLIKVYDKKPEGIIEYKEAEEKINQYLKQEKSKEEIKAYIENLREGAEIKRFLAS